jgi:hypothetical protein
MRISDDCRPVEHPLPLSMRPARVEAALRALIRLQILGGRCE